MRNLLVTFLTLISVLSYAQSKGKISGVVKDKDMGLEPLAFVSVYVQGNTSIGTTTDFDGNYALSLNPGKHTIVFDFVGYKPVKKAINVVAGKTQKIQVTMETLADALEAVIISVKTNKESEEAVITEMKESVEIVTAIGAEELSRKGVSDVAAAVTKAVGVSKQEGGSGSIFVRGLGDRYNFSTFNGLPLPSNNPSNKNISLDLFSTDIVEVVGINKTYSSNLYGDFAGALVNINSKEHTGDSYLSINIGTGVNSNAIDQSSFKFQDGTSLFGFDQNDLPNNSLSGHKFTTSLDSSTETPINKSISIFGGNKFSFDNGSSLSLFVTAGFDSGFSYKEGVSRGGVSRQGVIKKDLFRKSYGYNTNTTGMTNLTYKINSNNNIQYNLLFINSTNQNVDEFNGLIDIFDATGENFVKRSTFDKTQLLVNQLLGNHTLSDISTIKWGIAYNALNNVIPDRQQTTLFDPASDEVNQGQRLVIDSDLSTASSHRYFQELEDKEIAANLLYTLDFHEDSDYDDRRGKIKIGYNLRSKIVDFDATQINTQINKSGNNLINGDPNNLDSFFNQESFDANLLEYITFRQGQIDDDGKPIDLLPQFYEGTQFINAGFVNVNYKLTKKLDASLGVRFEAIEQNIEYNTSVKIGENNLSNTEILPSLSLKYALNDIQNLKLAASKTYTLPQFKEKAPFQYVDVTQIIVGNQYLYESTDYNADLKWEAYPEKGGFFGVTLFGKYIQNPINEMIKASATNDITYVNSGDFATVLGVELEAKYDLFKNGDESANNFSKLTGGVNVSYMDTNQEFNEDKIREENPGINVNFTNEEGRLSGASDLLANADLTYVKSGDKYNAQATLAYNYFSDKVYAIGTNNRGDLVDSEFYSLDLILKSTFNKKFKLGIKIKNILNPSLTRTQEVQDVVVNSYKKGVGASFSLGYTF